MPGTLIIRNSDTILSIDNNLLSQFQQSAPSITSISPYLRINPLSLSFPSPVLMFLVRIPVFKQRKQVLWFSRILTGVFMTAAIFVVHVICQVTNLRHLEQNSVQDGDRYLTPFSPTPSTGKTGQGTRLQLLLEFHGNHRGNDFFSFFSV